MLADVEPLAVIIRRTPGPAFINCHKPRIIALTELCQGLRARFLQDIQSVVAVVTLDRFPARIPEIHRCIPALLYRIRPSAPLLAQKMSLAKYCGWEFVLGSFPQVAVSDSIFVEFDVSAHHAFDRKVFCNVVSDCNRIELQIPHPFHHFSNRSAGVA
jgi:hypothetical protein